MPTTDTAHDVPALLTALQASDSGRPRLTWYGSQPGERVELSARVLANWVAKSANLLEEEFDAGPSVSLTLDLPADHWRSVALGLAALAVGAPVVTDGDVRVTTEGADDEGDLVVALAPLARSASPKPQRGLDFAAVITGYGDYYAPVSPIRLPSSPPSTAYQARVLLITPADLHQTMKVAVDVLRADGGLVLGPIPQDRLPQIEAQELITETR